MTQRKTPPCPPGLRSANRPAALRPKAIACGPDTGTVWEVLAPSGEILRMIVVEQYKAGDEAPFGFVRGIAVTRFVGSTGPRDTFVELEPGDELAVAHCWLEGPIRENLLHRCVAKVCAASLRKIEENRVPVTVPDLPEPIAAFRNSLKLRVTPIFRDSWRELYHQIGLLDDEGPTEVDQSEATTEAVFFVDLPRRYAEQQEEFAGCQAASQSSDSTFVSEMCAIAGDAGVLVRVAIAPDLQDRNRDQVSIELPGGSSGLHTYEKAILQFADGSALPFNFDGSSGVVVIETRMKSFCVKLIDKLGASHEVRPK